MNAITIFKKIILPILAFCALNSDAMESSDAHKAMADRQNPWAYFSAVHNGNQHPIKLPSAQKHNNVVWDWHKKCAELNKDQFLYELEQFFKVENNGFLADSSNWLNNQMPSNNFFSNTDEFEPYVMKLEVKPGAEIAFHGDIHGDKYSLISYLQWLAENGYTDPEDPFRIKKENFYIIFLGDYTDRGAFGAEVIFTIARLKRTNPNNVFLVRGNHEDVDLNAAYGFKKELEQKFNDDGTILKTVNRMYNYLPVALYLTCNKGTGYKDVILCDHGGIELGFNPATSQALLESNGTIKCTLLGDLLRETNSQDTPLLLNYIKKLAGNKNFTPKSPQEIHFMWNDFDVDDIRTTVKPGRGWECDHAFTHFVNQLQSTSHCRIRGIFRGHQHGENKMMNRILNRDKKNYDDDIGVGKLWITDSVKPKPGALWDGIVCTFSVCPHAGYGAEFKYNFDSFGILKTANQYTDWKLQMHRITPIIN